MTLTLLLALAATALLFLGCQASPSGPLPQPSATPPAAATAIAPATPPPATPTPSIGTLAPTAAPTLPNLPTTTPSPAAPSPAAAHTFPTFLEVPATDGAIRVEIMPNSSHFADTQRIGDIDPAGYSTIPPTSGRHWPMWSKCGFFNHPLPDELLVHNLEHGNIIVSYNLADDTEVEALRSAVAAIPLAAEFAIVRRYTAIPEGMVAVTAWGVLDRMIGVDPARIAGFFEDYPGNAGPEFANGLPCTTGIDLMQSLGS